MILFVEGKKREAKCTRSSSLARPPWLPHGRSQAPALDPEAPVLPRRGPRRRRGKRKRESGFIVGSSGRRFHRPGLFHGPFSRRRLRSCSRSRPLVFRVGEAGLWGCLHEGGRGGGEKAPPARAAAAAATATTRNNDLRRSSSPPPSPAPPPRRRRHFRRPPGLPLPSGARGSGALQARRADGGRRARGEENGEQQRRRGGFVKRSFSPPPPSLRLWQRRHGGGPRPAPFGHGLLRSGQARRRRRSLDRRYQGRGGGLQAPGDPALRHLCGDGGRGGVNSGVGDGDRRRRRRGARFARVLGAEARRGAHASRRRQEGREE